MKVIFIANNRTYKSVTLISAVKDVDLIDIN